MGIALADFRHDVGVHCSSTSIRDVLLMDGIAVPEPVVFGLGAGLGFWYIHDESVSPSRRFNGRSLDLERKFYAHVGERLTWIGRWDVDLMSDALAAGRPLLAHADIYYLPYYDPPVHFISHGIAIAGLDRERGTVLVADTAADEPIVLSMDALRAAIAPDHAPITYPYSWAIAPRVHGDVLTPETVRRAIATAVKEMLTPPHPQVGLPALRRMARELPAWADAADFVWAARFAYQTIQKRGTGGGAFRPLYGAFLETATTYAPEIAPLDAGQRFSAIGDLWVEAALLFKQIFVDEDRALFPAVAERMAHIADAEEGLLTEVGSVIVPS